MPKTTVIYHSADYDGIFSREIAKKFLGNDGVEYIGWDFGQPLIPMPNEGALYIIDLSPDCVEGLVACGGLVHPEAQRMIWIDHHKSSIEKFSGAAPGYRIDGVGACRLAWQWFAKWHTRIAWEYGADLPGKQDFIDRKVSEPLAVTLAGEYDIWDHAKSNNMDVAFQFGLDAQREIVWDRLLEDDEYASEIAHDGGAAMQCYSKRNADVMNTRSFIVEFEGLKFLCLNTARCNSNTFAAKDAPETGHDALMAFYYTGKGFSCSLYHAAHRKDLDLSQIAVKYGGGGHRGACGFRFDNFRNENGKFQII